MDYSGILKHAFSTTLHNRRLWILGFLWALVGGQGYNGISSYSAGSGDSDFMNGFQMQDPAVMLTTILSIIIILACVALLIAVLFTIVRYVVQAGVYRSLDQLEQDGTEPRVRHGLSEGWHRRTWRLFGQDVLVGLIFFLVVLLLFTIAASPLLLLLAQSEAVKITGVVLTIFLGLIAIAFAIVAGVGVSLLQQLWWRAAVLDDHSATGAISYAWALFKRHWGNVLVMWLLMLGVGIIFGIALIPVTLVLLALAAALGGGPGWLLYQATESAWAALAYGIPVAIIILAVPLMFIGGLYLIFQASVWNQVYRHLTGNEQAALALPEPAGGGE